MNNLMRTLLAGFLCLTLPAWGAYAAVPDFHPAFNSNAAFLPADEVSEGGLNLADLKFTQQEPEILNPGFLDSILGLTAPEEVTVLQNLEEQLADELYGSQAGKPFWLNKKVLVISGVVIFLSGLAILVGALAGFGGGSGSGSGAQGFSGGGEGAPQSLQSNSGTGDGDGTGEGENNGNQSENNPNPNDPNESNPNGNEGSNPPPGGGSGVPGGGGGEFDDGINNFNRTFPTTAPNNPEPGTMMLMLLGFCFPFLRKRFS